MRVKENIRTQEKSEVAAYAASLIEKGDLVYIDAGTTTGSIIEYITCSDAVYVTNGVRHAIRLAERGLNTYILSGSIKASTEAVIGYGAVENLRKYHFNKCFLGTDGVDMVNGLTTADIEESMVKSEALSRSREVYILADSSKFGKVAAITFGNLSEGSIITDKLINEEYREVAQVIELNK